MKMIVLYNLKDSVSDEEYKAYTEAKKGPFLESLPSCKSFKLIKNVATQTGEIPYKYVGIYDFTTPEELKKDGDSGPYQEFLEEWAAKVQDGFHIVIGEEVFGE